MPPSLSELIPIIFDMGLTHLTSVASNYIVNRYTAKYFRMNKGYTMKNKVNILKITHNLPLSQKSR